jgi:hypothetical protein
MLMHISHDQLVLLDYLHDHTRGSGERISLDPKLLARRLHISMTRLADDSACLAAHGFAGVRDFRPDGDDVPSAICSAIWVTGKGEDYLRRLESAPH